MTELTGRNHYEVNPDISAEWKQIHRKAQAGEFLKNDDDLWIQADGSRHWLRWAAYPWTNQEGETGGIIISCEDITARRIAEEELRNTQARLALVVEEVKAGYWDWDLNTSTVYLSPEWKRQIGFDENELLNRWEEWECRLHPDDRALVLAATENYIARPSCRSSKWSSACVTRMARTAGFTLAVDCCAIKITKPIVCWE